MIINKNILWSTFRSQTAHATIHKVPREHPNGIIVHINSHPGPIAPSCNAEPANVAQVVAGACVVLSAPLKVWKAPVGLEVIGSV